MILTCPSCATSYFTPDEAIGPTGRTVRCKSCQTTWRATLDEPLELGAEPAAAATTPAPEVRSFGKRDEAAAETLAETPAPELPKAFRARAEAQRRIRRAAAHGAVWAGIASGFVALFAAAWLFRVEVVDVFPKAATAYAAVGAPVNVAGLDFEAVSARAAPNDPGRVLVAGALRNVRDHEVVSPPVRVALLDAHGAEIGAAVVRIDGPPVLPGGVQGFAAYIADPGARGQGVGVDFAPDAAPAVAVARPKPAPHVDARRIAEAHPPEPEAHAVPAADVHAEPAPLRPAFSEGHTPAADLPPIDAKPTHG